MESRNRNRWAVVLFVAAATCLCLAALAAVLIAWQVLDWDLGEVGVGRQQDRVEEAFPVGDAPRLEIDDFAGRITVRGSEGNEVRVVATKVSRTRSSLDRITLEMSQEGDRVVIRSRRPSLLSGARVDLEISAPTGTELEVRTGSGSVDIQRIHANIEAETGSGQVEIRDVVGSLSARSGSGGVTIVDVEGPIEARTGSGGISVRGSSGDIIAHTGSGGIEVWDASGSARLDTGSGGIDYEGTLQGECRFETGSGGIVLRLPADLDMRVDLSTGSDSVEVAYDVSGEVSRKAVRGTIGTGEDGQIYAHTGSGGIDLIRR